MRAFLPLALITLLLVDAGCVSAPVTRPAASQRPLARPSSAIAGPRVAGAPSDRNPIGIPSRVTLTLPPSLGVVSTGSGGLISDQGGSILTDAGAGMAPPRQIQAAAADCEVPEFVPLGLLIPEFSSLYLLTARLVEYLLRELVKADAQPGQTLTFAYPSALDPRRPAGGSQEMTARLDVAEGRLTVRFAEGPTVGGSQDMGRVTFMSPESGQLVVRPPSPRNQLGRVAVYSEFDLAVGEVMAEGVIDPGTSPEAVSANPVVPCLPLYSRTRFRWRFTTLDPTASQGAVFRMRALAYREPTPAETGQYGVQAHFLADGSAAVKAGRQTQATGGRFAWAHNDGSAASPDLSLAHDLYLGFEAAPGRGLFDLSRDDASAALRAIVPPDFDFSPEAPPAPNPADPLAESIFTLDP